MRLFNNILILRGGLALLLGMMLTTSYVLGSGHPVVLGPIPGISLARVMEDGFFAENLAYNKRFLKNREDFPKMMLGGQFHIACLDHAKLQEFKPEISAFYLNGVLAFDKSVMLALSFRQASETTALRLEKMALVLNLNDAYRHSTRLGKISLPFQTYLAIGKFNLPFGKFNIPETIKPPNTIETFKKTFYSGILVGIDKDFGIYNAKGTYFINPKKWDSVNGNVHVTVYQPNFDFVCGGGYSQIGFPGKIKIVDNALLPVNNKIIEKVIVLPSWSVYVGFIKHGMTVKATTVRPFTDNIKVNKNNTKVVDTLNYSQIECAWDLPKTIPLPIQMIVGLCRAHRGWTKEDPGSRKVWIHAKYKIFNGVDLNGGVFFEQIKQENNKHPYRKTYQLQLRCFF